VQGSQAQVQLIPNSLTRPITSVTFDFVACSRTGGSLFRRSMQKGGIINHRQINWPAPDFCCWLCATSGLCVYRRLHFQSFVSAAVWIEPFFTLDRFDRISRESARSKHRTTDRKSQSWYYANMMNQTMACRGKESHWYSSNNRNVNISIFCQQSLHFLSHHLSQWSTIPDLKYIEM